MRKSAFYARLAAAGLWRNRRTYLPYLLAGTVTVAAFYILLAIAGADSLYAAQSPMAASTIESLMYVGAWLLAMLSAIILFWTNGFLIKQRRQELGLYTVMGLEKSGIAAMLFFETLLVAALALVSGLAAGMLFARLLFLVMQRIVRFEVALTLPVAPRAIVITALFFLAYLGNLRRIRKLNPVEILAEAKQGQREPKASLLVTLAGLVFLVCGYLLALREMRPNDAIPNFLLAAILVIIGTYLLFLSGSVFFLKLLRRNKRYYYHRRHFVNVSGMIYRMRQNAAGLASICVLSCMVMVTVAATVALYAGRGESILRRYPYTGEIRLYSDQHVADYLDDVVYAIADEAGAEVTLYARYDLYYNSWFFANPDGTYSNATPEDSYDTGWKQAYYMLLKDYNALTGQSINLAGGEALLHTRGATHTGDTMTIDDLTWRVYPAGELFGLPNGALDSYTVYTLILPDEAALAAQLESWSRAVPGFDPANTMRTHISFDIDGSAESVARFNSLMQGWWNEEMAGVYNYQLTLQSVETETWLVRNGTFLFLGAYFGVLFLLAAALIIYYKQVTEGYEDRTRYDILQQVGMSGGEVRRTIHSQVSIAFFLPLGVALVHICVAIPALHTGLAGFYILNPTYLLAALGATALVYALVYGLVYLRTARTYYKIVERKPTAG